MTTSLLADAGSSLAMRGFPIELLSRTQLDAGSTGKRLGRDFAAGLAAARTDPGIVRDLLVLARQLFAAGFEEAFARATGPAAPPPQGDDAPDG